MGAMMSGGDTGCGPNSSRAWRNSARTSSSCCCSSDSLIELTLIRRGGEHNSPAGYLGVDPVEQSAVAAGFGMAARFTAADQTRGQCT